MWETVNNLLPLYLDESNLGKLKTQGFLNNDNKVSMKGQKILLERSFEDYLQELHAMYGCQVTKGNCDLIVTNVPYGTLPSNSWKHCLGGSRLESHAVYETVDFLKPGGTAVIIVPTGIIERQEHLELRKYVLENCHIEAIISLPKYTFAPYTQQKTYVLVLKKRLPHLEPIFSTFIYLSECDGKAQSDKRFRTDLLENRKNEGIVFLHDDFSKCPGRFNGNYKSLLEKAWAGENSSATDQDRTTDEWTEYGWKKLPGKKWGQVTIVYLQNYK